MASSRIRKKKTVPNDFVAIEDFVFDGDDLFDDLAFEMEENEHFNDDETQCENLHSVDAYSDEESHNVNEHGVIDEEKSIAPEQKEKEKKVGSNSYTCSYCVKVYKTLSGRTRHEKNVHNDRDKPVHNKAKGTEDDNGLITTSIISHGAKHVHADISTEEVWENMSTVIHHTLQEMQNNKHLSIKGSAYGNQVVAVAKCVAENSNIIAVLSPILKDRYLAEFIKATSVKSLLNGGVRETLFKSFDEVRMDSSFLSSFQSVLDDAECIVDGFKRFTKLFISCFIRQFSVEVLKEIIEKKITQLKDEDNSEGKPESLQLSDNDSKVLYLVSGYILFALKKKCSRYKNDKYKNAIALLKSLIKTNNSCSKQYVVRHSDWLEKINRGGLIYPADDFFLLIKEMEIIMRKNINMKKLSFNSLSKSVMTEHISASFMVHYYWDSLCAESEDFVKLFVLELIINLFLTIRSFALLKHVKAKYEQEQGSNRGEKSLRKVLKEKSVNVLEL